MPVSTRETIFALSSGRPPAAIAVVRISGPHAGDALKALTGKIPVPRQAALARVRGRAGEMIDQALVLWFPGPHSETGEDVAELQLHGGRAVVAAVLDALSMLEGLRPAEAGEFTRRAFENGKLDLTAAEGLADLVMAETEGQRRQAFRQMTGALGYRAESWRAQLIQALALIEARIDFSDEADVPEDLVTPALQIVRALEGEIASALADGGRGERLREGLVVAIAGPPNAGKSTLLNRIAKREAAIVSPYAGTTRDVIEVHLDLAGLPVTLLDTAGIRESGDPVELEGVRRARARANAADLVLWVVDASDPAGVGSLPSSGLMPVGPSQAGKDHPAPTSWLIRNKIDLLPKDKRRNEYIAQNNRRNELEVHTNKFSKNMVSNALKKRTEFEFNLNESEFDVSALAGEGFDVLLAQLQVYADNYLAGAESAVITRTRHRLILADTVAALRRALVSDLAAKDDLLAEELRVAATALGRLTGRVDIEDILDVIFRDFCIGK
jgi:tRNA modification GTPase